MDDKNKITKKRSWMIDFYRAIAHAKFFAELKSDTSLRLGYVLLDNAVEQLLKSYLNSKNKLKKKNNIFYLQKKDENNNIELKKINFFNLIEGVKQEIKDSDNILDRILREHHERRNILYHSSSYLSISKEKFEYYLDDIFSLSELLKIDDAFNKVSEEFKKVIQNGFDKIYLTSDILSKKCDERIKENIKKKEKEKFKAYMEIGSLIKNEFELPEDRPANIFLASPPGITNSAIEGMNIILSGALNTQKQAKILETIDGKSSLHSFFISPGQSNLWYCFYNCFWSENGMSLIKKEFSKGVIENRYEGQMEFQNFKKLYENNKDKIDYRIGLIPVYWVKDKDFLKIYFEH